MKLPDDLVIGLEHMADCTSHVKVSYTPELRFRLWLAIQLVKVAVWVAGCQVNMEFTHGADESDGGADGHR